MPELLDLSFGRGDNGQNLIGAYGFNLLQSVANNLSSLGENKRR